MRQGVYSSRRDALGREGGEGSKEAGVASRRVRLRFCVQHKRPGDRDMVVCACACDKDTDIETDTHMHTCIHACIHVCMHASGCDVRMHLYHWTPPPTPPPLPPPQVSPNCEFPGCLQRAVYGHSLVFAAGGEGGAGEGGLGGAGEKGAAGTDEGAESVGGKRKKGKFRREGAARFCSKHRSLVRPSQKFSLYSIYIGSTSDVK
jgi:hypothetical protein